MRWVLREKDKHRNIPLLERILRVRGFERKEIERFLNPSLSHLYSPFLFEDMQKAVKRIIKEIEIRGKIGIFGDYDADGVCASSFLFRKFRELGIKPVAYIPSRLKEGYGISKKGLELLKKRGVNLVISVDCGISAIEEVMYARKLGMDVIVTDHHEPKRTFPPAFAIINPKSSKHYPFKYLSGAGVAFKLMEAIYERLKFDKKELYWDLDLIAIGTIADQVPLVEENRVFAHFGLRVIENTKKAGIKAIKKSSSIKNRVTSWHVNFIIAPRLNASGRMEHARKSAELLITKDGDIAMNIAEYLEEKNKLRQNIQDMIYSEARKLTKEDDSVHVLASKEWHEGVVGIVASKILDKTGKPAFLFVIEDGIAKGSARSIPEFDLIKALEKCEDLFIEYGGHKLAAGVKLKENNLEKFRKRINEIAGKILNEEKLERKIYIDVKTDLDILLKEGNEILEKLSPFGEGNPEPVFLIENLTVLSKPEKKNKKINFYTGDEKCFIKGYYENDNSLTLQIGDRIDAVCEFRIIKGEKTLKIIDFKIR